MGEKAKSKPKGDPELIALARIQRVMDQVEPPARFRILSYLRDRYTTGPVAPVEEQRPLPFG